MNQDFLNKGGMNGFPVGKLAKVILVIVALLILAVPILILGNMLTDWQFSNAVSAFLERRLMWNHYLIQIVGALGAALLVFAFKSSFSFRKHKRRIAAGIFMGIFLLYNLVLWMNQRKNYFDNQGNPIKFCDLVGDGYHCFDRPGIDPETGNPLKQMSLQDLESINPGVYTPKEVASPGEVPWFDQHGAPMLWYGRTISGKFVFFRHGGTNPATGETLQPVSRDIRVAWEQQIGTPGVVAPKIHEEQTGKSHATAETLPHNFYIQGAGHQQVGVVFTASDQAAHTAASQLLSSLIGVNITAINPAAASQPAVASRLAAGDSKLIASTVTSTGLRVLVVAGTSLHCEHRTESDASLLSCDLNVQARKYDPSGLVIGSRTMHATGAGYSADQATENAVVHMANGLSAFCNQ